MVPLAGWVTRGDLRVEPRHAAQQSWNCKDGDGSEPALVVIAQPGHRLPKMRHRMVPAGRINTKNHLCE